MANEEVYYLSSLESERLSPVRRCTVLSRIQFASGKECLVVSVDPSILAQEFGVRELDTAVLVARHEGEGFSPIRRYPCFVFVCRTIGGDARRLPNEIERKDVEIIGWGELYRTANDAEKHVFDAVT